MKKLIYILFLILFTLNVTAYNNIYTFDDQSKIILTTTVYKEGVPTSNATCNLTIFNPPPNESIINISVLMNNKGNSIFSYNLTGLLDYNEEIYPLSLSCNDSEGIFGSDERVGIKIGAKLYDFIIGGGILIFIAFLFIYMSFKINEELVNLRLFMFWLGLVFILISLFYGLTTSTHIPGGESISLIFTTTIIIYIFIIMILMYLQFIGKLETVANKLAGSK